MAKTKAELMEALATAIEEKENAITTVHELKSQIAKVEACEATLKEFENGAYMLRRMHEMLVAQGFTDKQAMQLITAMITTGGFRR